MSFFLKDCLSICSFHDTEQVICIHNLVLFLQDHPSLTLMYHEKRQARYLIQEQLHWYATAICKTAITSTVKAEKGNGEQRFTLSDTNYRVSTWC